MVPLHARFRGYAVAQVTFFLLIDKSLLMGEVGPFMMVDDLLISKLVLLILVPANDVEEDEDDVEDEDEVERNLGSARHSSRLTFASGIEGARDASRISVNFEVVIVE